jgi:hypothetical protein
MVKKKEEKKLPTRRSVLRFVNLLPNREGKDGETSLKCGKDSVLYLVLKEKMMRTSQVSL